MAVTYPELPAADDLSDLTPKTKLPVLIRATDGKSKHKKEKIKLATVVDVENIPEFYAKYAEICRARMTGLKKRDRTKAKKKKKTKKEES